ncbi:DUF805 domain-containing protein [Acidithiobacillus sulfuriphilus]|uniref:DUF805 domain-containing protein n=1 Tax=Acidithiobacillus sulfuriphilus TaxID=1867749 RepID=UPI003F62A09F
MRMVSAFKNVVMNNYANFDGRLGRAEFWWFYLMDTLIAVAIAVVTAMIFQSAKAVYIAVGAYYVILLLPMLSAEVRRLHDIGLSGWWLLVTLIPYLGGLMILIFLVMPPKPTGERFGSYTDNADA